MLFKKTGAHFSDGIIRKYIYYTLAAIRELICNKRLISSSRWNNFARTSVNSFSIIPKIIYINNKNYLKLCHYSQNSIFNLKPIFSFDNFILLLKSSKLFCNFSVWAILLLAASTSTVRRSNYYVSRGY